ncbi:ribosomal protein S18-alanine N-acetyltransferase [Salinifilum aidingensis]
MTGADVTVLRLRRSDLRRCAVLEQELFPGDDPWAKEMFESELNQGHYYLGAYDADDRLLGYAGLALLGSGDGAEAEVHTIGVDPHEQGRGVGTALLRALLERADERGAATFLEVRTDNEAAIGMYRAHGFEIVGTRRHYYQPSGAHAYTMRRERVAGAQDAREEAG